MAELLPGFTYGNLVLFVTIVVSVAGGWARVESGLADHDRRILELEDTDKSLMNERIKEARDVADMKADMRWIRVTLERLEREWKSRE